MNFTTEKIEDNIEALSKLSKIHYKEVAPYDDIPLNVNWGILINLCKSEVLKFYGLRHEGELIGYCTFFINYSIEYSSSLQASLSNIFIHPDHRGQGLKFISWCDEQLNNLGVQVVYHHVKAKNDYGKLLKRLGYERMNIEYSKRLDKE